MAACTQVSLTLPHPSAHDARHAAGIVLRKLPSGGYRLYSRKKDARTGKRRNPGTFAARAAAEEHEREVQSF